MRALPPPIPSPFYLLHLLAFLFQVLSYFSQQLHEVWSAFFYGSLNIVLPTGGGNHTGLIPSPWAKATTIDAPAPCSLFVALPAWAYLSSPHSLLMVRAACRGWSGL